VHAQGNKAHLLNEGVESAANAPQEAVVPTKLLAILLQQIHADRQDAPQHMGQAGAQLQAAAKPANHIITFLMQLTVAKTHVLSHKQTASVVVQHGL
jgi:hypothetical protein